MVGMTFEGHEIENMNWELNIRVVFDNKEEYDKKVDTVISFFQHDILRW